MQIEQEIEFKSLIEEKKFKELMMYFSLIGTKKEQYLQTNYYFDDQQRSLNEQGITLRLRCKKEQWELTAKLPSDKKTVFSESTEYNESLSEEEANQLLEYGIEPNHPFIQKLIALTSISFEKPLVHLGSLQTERHDFNFYTDMISLDKSTYNGIIDYEVEWETSNPNFVQMHLKQLNILIGNGKGKRKRFLKTLKSL